MYKIKNTELDFESRIFHLHKIFYSAKGIEFQYKFYFRYWYATKNISISTSSDRNAWVNHGNVSGLPAQEFHYIQFVKPVTARYIKVSIKGYHTGGVQLSSIKMFE